MPRLETDSPTVQLIVASRLREENEKLRNQVKELESHITELKTQLENKKGNKEYVGPDFFVRFGEIA